MVVARKLNYHIKILEVSNCVSYCPTKQRIKLPESKPRSRSFNQKLPVSAFADIFLARPAKALSGITVAISTVIEHFEKCKNGNKRGRSLLAIQVMAVAERGRSALCQHLL